MRSKHPINLALRFLLELAAIFTFGFWGHSQAGGGTGVLLAVLLPLLFAVLWGVFAVRGDPSRSGENRGSNSGNSPAPAGAWTFRLSRLDAA